jgi:hypothetical protein
MAICQKFTEEIRYFSFKIERTFLENSQDALAKFVVDAIKKYEQERAWGWSLIYPWKINSDSSRSLWCLAEIPDREFRIALGELE